MTLTLIANSTTYTPSLSGGLLRAPHPQIGTPTASLISTAAKEVPAAEPSPPLVPDGFAANDFPHPKVTSSSSLRGVAA